MSGGDCRHHGGGRQSGRRESNEGQCLYLTLEMAREGIVRGEMGLARYSQRMDEAFVHFAVAVLQDVVDNVQHVSHHEPLRVRRFAQVAPRRLLQ
jgi:hypothetical protein